LIYGARLPRYGRPQTNADCCRYCGYLVSLILSVLAHGLVYWLFIIADNKLSANKSDHRPQTMEVTLSAAPKPKPASAQKPSQPKPEMPKPSPKPPATKPEKPPVIKPIPKPPRPKRPAPPTEQTLPEPPKPRKPTVKPTPEKDELPEFKDDFSELSKEYSRAAPQAQGYKSLGSNPGESDSGNHPGSILNINPRIHYPVQAMRQGMQGMVVVLIHIAPDGSTDGVDLLKSSGYEALDNEVLGAVQHWRFKPPMRGGTPVAGVYKHRVIFGADENVTDEFENHWKEIELQPAEE
jgi:protein TonB